ncbi:hypothetical protein PLICRDRAFT_58140 [Plicaturopsis crispa FD-325 SS-3]|uniref:Unplaced genomic scaffold PLICRscaffold_20, whole genome shotgun sequence n=1 Tax=Plicaturopsis crispa FD-325 SS-3 TaxID=944288 RepID=A0A0C9T3U4_PLICR|nr:hypothetical protein PLICRDRAFT_58140 [Plicaturopsis crispa FD-325 SS-3]
MALNGSNERPTTRTRTDGSEDEHSSNAEPNRSSTVWYQDGSIVLQAANTRFRVHHTILAKNSPIFGDMMSIGEPGGDENVEGCPLVVLHDSAEDLETLLRALYDRQYFDPRKTQPLSVITPILRLSKKYEIQYLYDDALGILTTEYPDTLKGWDEKFQRSVPAITRYAGLSFDVANLARELDLQSLLPCALYRCLLQDLERILDGITDPETSHVLKLSPHNQRVVMLGLPKVMCWSMNTACMWIGEGMQEMKQCNSKKCKRGFKGMSDYFRSAFPRSRALHRWSSKWDHKFCEKCLEVVKPRYEERRAHFWTQLPVYFDLAPSDG